MPGCSSSSFRFHFLLDVGHALSVVIQVLVLVGHHLIQESLVSGLGFRFGFLTVGVVDPKVDSGFRQPWPSAELWTCRQVCRECQVLQLQFSIFDLSSVFGVGQEVHGGSCGGASPGATAAAPVPPS